MIDGLMVFSIAALILIIPLIASVSWEIYTEYGRKLLSARARRNMQEDR